MATYGPDWGVISIDRFTVVENLTADENGGEGRKLSLEGQESSPPSTTDECVNHHEQVKAMEAGKLVPVVFTDKTSINGYYLVESSSSVLTDYQGEVQTADWKISLTRMGSDTEVDLQSRLTGAVRQNDFSLTGEKWHAPSIGHYAYFTGSTSPSVMTRATAEGEITVYRNVPTNVSPRWGCDVGDYNGGRVRVVDFGLVGYGSELEGVDRPVGASTWELSNGLVNVSPTSSAGVLDVKSYTNGEWHSKLWEVTLGGSRVAAWDSASLIRNEQEQCVLRLVASRSPGRAVLDLTLRRGSRVVEGYFQSGSSTTLGVALVEPESNVNTAASGYLTASGDDADGNRFVCGSARSFTGSTTGAMSKAAATSMDFFLGVVAGQPTLNTNPSFEVNTAGWSATNAVLTRSDAQAKHGSWSGLLTAGAGSAPRAQCTPAVVVTPGSQYQASGWLYAPAAIAAGVAVNINWLDESQAYLSTSSNSTVPVSGDWFFMNATHTAPSGAAYAVVLYTINGTPGAGVLLYGDDIRIRKAVPSGDSATDLRNQYIGALAESTHAVKR
jgi:hypothetical protein